MNIEGLTVGKTFDVIRDSGEKDSRNYKLYICKCRECGNEEKLNATTIRKDAYRCKKCFISISNRAKMDKDKRRGDTIEKSVFFKLYGYQEEVPAEFISNFQIYLNNCTDFGYQVIEKRYGNRLTMQQTADVLNMCSRQNIHEAERIALERIKTQFEEDFGPYNIDVEN